MEKTCRVRVWHALRYEGRGVVPSSATPIAYGSERATPIFSFDEAEDHSLCATTASMKPG